MGRETAVSDIERKEHDGTYGAKKVIIFGDDGAGNRVALKVNADGELVTLPTNVAQETGGNLASIKAKTDNIPALGQALAANSVPVILPTATITTLTPPAAITGFATSANQDPLAAYKTQVIDNYTTTNVVYICKMKSDGTWLFIKIDKTGSFPTFTYANVSNNAGKTYSTAYSARTTLTYGLLNTLTL